MPNGGEAGGLPLPLTLTLTLTLSLTPALTLTPIVIRTLTLATNPNQAGGFEAWAVFVADSGALRRLHERGVHHPR